jgi:glycosyltransferase involved in cell wall biosynthesis
MYNGIIIVFHNDEKNINVEQLVSIIKKNNYKICLVNNASTDNTIAFLEQIKIQFDLNSKVFVLDNKHNKGLKNALKFGARFLQSESKFNTIIYLEAKKMHYLQYINEYFTQLALEKSAFNAIPTRSSRNALKDVYDLNELIKEDCSV